MSIATLAASFLLAVTPPQVVQDPPSSLPDVTVSGVRGTETEARRFLEEISTAPSHALSLARWTTSICLATDNLREASAAALTTRIEARARAVGVVVRPPGCSPNVTILATSDGRATATDLVDAYHDRFMASPGLAQGDERDLRRFAEAEVAVRWWTISALMDDRSHKILIPMWGNPAAAISSPGGGFFGQNRREGLVTSLVILDLSRMGGVTDEALGDYLSMVILANIEPETRAGGYPTILNLWDGGAVSSGLTQWDQAYLTALYEADVRMPGGIPMRSLYQRTEMARIMARELAGDEPAP
jgi:hypothetical protein